MNDFFLFTPMVRCVKAPHSHSFIQEMFMRASCVPGGFVRHSNNSKMNEVDSPVPQGGNQPWKINPDLGVLVRLSERAMRKSILGR